MNIPHYEKLSSPSDGAGTGDHDLLAGAHGESVGVRDARVEQVCNSNDYVDASNTRASMDRNKDHKLQLAGHRPLLVPVHKHRLR